MDLDNDNIGEFIFVYKIVCILDVFLVGLKLVMLEDGKKFILRGNIIIKMGDDKFGGDKIVDVFFKNGLDNFLLYVNKIWNSIN